MDTQDKLTGSMNRLNGENKMSLTQRRKNALREVERLENEFNSIMGFCSTEECVRMEHKIKTASDIADELFLRFI